MATILIVEDDPLIAFSLKQLLCDEFGADVVVASTVAQAELALAAGRMDVTLLDIDLRGETTYDIARGLQRAGTPFAFISGAPASDMPADLASARLLAKPCRMADISGVVARACQDGVTNKVRA